MASDGVSLMLPPPPAACAELSQIYGKAESTRGPTAMRRNIGFFNGFITLMVI